MTALRLANSSAGVLAPWSAPETRGVTFPVDCGTLTSRSGGFISASGAAAKQPSRMKSCSLVEFF
jgi:hypothetical protein